MNRVENPDANAGYEYHFDGPEEWVGRMEKRTYEPHELFQLYLHVRNHATDWHEERFNDYWFDENEAEFCYHFANLVGLKLEIENTIVREEQPTDEDIAAFIAEDKTTSTPSDEEFEAFRANLEQDRKTSQ